MSSVTATQAPKSNAYRVRAGHASRASPSSHMPDAGARADDQRDEQLPLHVARRARARSATSSGRVPGCGGNRRSSMRASRGMSSSM